MTNKIRWGGALGLLLFTVLLTLTAFAQDAAPPAPPEPLPASLPGVDLNVFTAIIASFFKTPANLLLILAVSALAWLWEITPILNSRYVPHFCVGCGALANPFLADKSALTGYPHPWVALLLSGIIVGAIAAAVHKPLMKRFGVLPLLLLLCLGVGACSTARGVKTAAYLGTALALDEHPNWKPAFQQAYDDLGVIEAAETIGIPEVLAILHRLPIKELKSPKAVIIITATALLIEETGSPELSPVTTGKLRPVVKDLRAGIKLALDNSFADYRPDGTLRVAAR